MIGGARSPAVGGSAAGRLVAQVHHTLATAQADFSDLPPELGRPLPRRNLPVAVLAWLGVSENRQGEGLGSRLLAQALRDGYDAGRTFAVIAVLLDCIDESAGVAVTP